MALETITPDRLVAFTLLPVDWPARPDEKLHGNPPPRGTPPSPLSKSWQWNPAAQVRLVSNNSQAIIGDSVMGDYISQTLSVQSYPAKVPEISKINAQAYPTQFSPIVGIRSWPTFDQVHIEISRIEVDSGDPNTGRTIEFQVRGGGRCGSGVLWGGEVVIAIPTNQTLDQQTGFLLQICGVDLHQIEFWARMKNNVQNNTPVSIGLQFDLRRSGTANDIPSKLPINTAKYTFQPYTVTQSI